MVPRTMLRVALMFLLLSVPPICGELRCLEICSLGYPTMKTGIFFCEIADSDDVPIGFELPQAACSRVCCGTFQGLRMHDLQSARVVAPEAMVPLPNRDEFVKTAALAVSKQLGPDVQLLLQSICERIPHAVVKLDGQPTGFPMAITIGGDVDILTTEKYAPRLCKHVEEHFKSFAPIFHLVKKAEQPGNWRYRLERNGHLVYLFHVMWRPLEQAQLAETMLSRRAQARRGNNVCLWTLAKTDELLLRDHDCNRSRAAVAYGKRISAGKMLRCNLDHSRSQK